VILDLQGSTRSVDEMLDVAGSLTEGLLARAA